MKSITWEAFTGALTTFLTYNTQALPVDAYTITLQTGQVLRYSGGDMGFTVNGQTYVAGPVLKRSRTRQVIGIEVDTLDMELFADSSVQVNGVGIISAIALGMFSGATVRVESVFFDLDQPTLTPIGMIPMFYGRVGQVMTGKGRASLQVRSHSELLDIRVPGDVYQPNCKNTLYDAYCKLNRNDFRFSKTAAVGTGPSKIAFEVSEIQVAAVRVPEGRFNIGIAIFTSGANANVMRTIRTHTRNGTNERLELLTPTPYPVAIGDAVLLFYGCNKTQGWCSSVFNNLTNFRGEPYIPAPEVVT